MTTSVKKQRPGREPILLSRPFFQRLRPKSIKEANAIQSALEELVKIAPLQEPLRSIAGVDAVFSGNTVTGVAAIFTYPALTPVDEASATVKASFPYRPGYLSFREGPALIEAVLRLKKRPGLILCDGQGIAHPRRMGIASFLGVWLDLPAVGCAKSRLVGEFEMPGIQKGNWSPLSFNGKVIGAVLRTKEKVRPIFVSPGHRVSLEDAIRIVLVCCQGFRIPEPIRRADMLSRKLQKKMNGTPDRKNKQ